MDPHVVVESPAGWLPADVARPKIAENAGAEWSDYVALAPAAGDAAIVCGCVATPIPGWVDDMRPAVEGRGVALAGAVAERITGRPMSARADGAGGFVLRPAEDVDGAPIGAARTFLGFEGGRVLTCFATCASRSAVAWRACEPAATGARLEGSAPPPPPGLGLQAVTWAVHHPHPAVGWGAAFVVATALLALLTRRRPRTR